MTNSKTAMTNQQKLQGLAVWIGLCFFTAGFGAWLTNFGVQGWYTTIVKPPFNPPNIVFPVVWNTLYLLLAFSGWRIWLAVDGQWKHTLVQLMLGQLALNIVWSGLFFTWHLIDVALFELTVMVILAWMTWLRYWPVKPIAAQLMTPYVLWITFAVVLNGSIWWLNR